LFIEKDKEAMGSTYIRFSRTRAKVVIGVLQKQQSLYDMHKGWRINEVEYDSMAPANSFSLLLIT
jgi:hypothetical protein